MAGMQRFATTGREIAVTGLFVAPGHDRTATDAKRFADADR